MTILCRFGQNNIFLKFSLFFQKPYFVRSCGFLRCVQCIKTLLLSNQKLSLDNFSNFFIIRVFGGVQKLPGMEKRLKKNIENILNQGAKWNKKIAGRSFVIICGAFNDTLLFRVQRIIFLMNQYVDEYYLQKTYSMNTKKNIFLDIFCHKYG